jgi:hypothetical protein
MSGNTTDPAAAANRTLVIFYVAAAVLIGSFLWRLLTPAHEYPMRTEQVMSIVMDLALTIGISGLWKASRGPAALYWPALASGIGLFLIRLHGNASWWTGHWSYWLPPR